MDKNEVLDNLTKSYKVSNGTMHFGRYRVDAYIDKKDNTKWYQVSVDVNHTQLRWDTLCKYRNSDAAIALLVELYRQDIYNKENK